MKKFGKFLVLAWAWMVLAAPLSAVAQTAPIFVLNSLEASVSLVDPVAWKELRRFPTGKEPHHLYLTPDEKSLIIANALSDSLLFVNPRTGEMQKTVRGIIDPYHLRFSPDMKWFVTASQSLEPCGYLPLERYRHDAGQAHFDRQDTQPPVDQQHQHDRVLPRCRRAMNWWPSTCPRRP